MKTGPKPKDYTNYIFKNLRVIKMTYQKSGNISRRACVCLCICGNTKVILLQSLIGNHTKSCGCVGTTTHGATSRRNGKKVHPLYNIFNDAKKRCYNHKHKSFVDYGGRGIRVCEEWLNSYETFRDYMLALPNCPWNAEIPKSRLARQIDRINNDGNYEPGNVRWVTRKNQNYNKRNNRTFKVNGKRMSLAEIVDKWGKAPYPTVLRRLTVYGWTLKTAVLTPPNEKVF